MLVLVVNLYSLDFEVIKSWTIKKTLQFYSFFLIWMPLISFSYVTVLAISSSTMLKRSEYLFLYLGRKHSVVTIQYDISCTFFINAFYKNEIRKLCYWFLFHCGQRTYMLWFKYFLVYWDLFYDIRYHLNVSCYNKYHLIKAFFRYNYYILDEAV